ncbi:MAG: LysR family transcriptional regulator substrate-binding protein [Pirellula sp.]
METLVELANSNGDASKARQRLAINQPSMSKRLKLLQQSDRVGLAPWVQRAGQLWTLTVEGTRNLPAVRQLLRLEQSLGSDIDTRSLLQPTVSIDCGQTAVTSILKAPLNQFRKEFKDARVRISTPRGTARIQGVANGTYDFALVTHDEADIHRIAGRSLYVETLHEDPFMLVCGKKAREAVRLQFEHLPKRPANIKELVRFPLILPEPDAGLRRSLDHAFSESDLFGKLDIILEVGGWSATLDFVRDGWGVGIVTQSAITSDAGLLPPHQLDIPDVPPTAVRLIARLSAGKVHPDLLPESERLTDMIRHQRELPTPKK